MTRFSETAYLPNQTSALAKGPWLILAPHPDDESFGMGGTLLLAKQQNIRVNVIFLTDGRLGGSSESDLTTTREAEAQQACHLLGIDKPHFWREPDRGLSTSQHLIDKLSSFIQTFQPAAVFFPSPLEPHPDHRATSVIAWEALRKLNFPAQAISYDISVQSHTNQLIDISETIEQKQQLMSCYASQLSENHYIDRIVGLNKARAWSLPLSVSHAEAFFLWPAENRPLNAMLLDISAAQSSPSALSEQLPLISVITRTQNRPELLREAIRSVGGQTYPNIELIVVNDGGVNCENIVQQEASGHIQSFQYHHFEQQQGRSQAANQGLSLSQGEYLIFLDDDDWLEYEHIQQLYNAIQSSSDAQAAYSATQCFDDQKQALPDQFAYPFDANRLIVGNFIPIHSVLFSRALLDQGCRFDETLDVYEDWDFWIQASRITNFLFVNQFTANYRIGGQSGFGVNFNQDKAEQNSIIIFRKWFAQLSDDDLLLITHQVREHQNAIQQLNENNKLLQDLTNQLEKSNNASKQKENKIQQLELNIAEKKREALEQQSQIQHLESNLNTQNEKIIEFNTITHQYAEKVEHLNQQIRHLEQDLRSHKDQLMQIFNSRSWHITKPLRAINRISPIKWLRELIYHFFRKIWLAIPVSLSQKQSFKQRLFNHAPVIFKHSKAYKDWHAFENPTEYPSAPLAVENAPTTQSSANQTEEIYNAYLRTAHNQTISEFVDYAENNANLSASAIKFIAFYLPQFHPIDENDREWGKGFTEWTNVSKATPQYTGHYQPRLPGELGFYDLRLKEIQQRQIELAKNYGLHGFCYHYYWFNGKKVLDKPLQQILDDSSLDFPFCICWANENWTRRWDGGEDEIILAQKHSPEDDLHFIQDLDPIIRDPRYIRIDGKPLVIVYRPELLPDPKLTAQRWRQYTQQNGIGDLFIVAAATFGFDDYQRIGYDGLVQFPPHNIGAKEISDQVALSNANFHGHIFDYRDYAQQALKKLKGKTHTFPCVMMDWDNEARKPGRGHIFHHCSPQNYQQWLNDCADYVLENNTEQEQFVFINAWNEWAEGTYLEPDRRYGYAYLDATREVLLKHLNQPEQTRKIILVTHDAHPMGAQYLVLNLARTLSAEFNFEVALITLGEGALILDYLNCAKLHNLSNIAPDSEQARAVAEQLAADGYPSAIVNSTASGLFLKTLHDVGIHCISLVHELPGIVESYNLYQHAETIADYAQAVIFPDRYVSDRFVSKDNLSEQQLKIRTQGLYKLNALKNDIATARRQLRSELNLSEEAKIVLGVGYADFRKGIDLFVEIALSVGAQTGDCYFVWLGDWDNQVKLEVEKQLENRPFADRLIFPGRRSDTDAFYAGADLLALTSREDPFPSVMMESLNVGVPIVGFENVGGSETLLKQGCGILVPFEDCQAFSHAVLELLADSPKRQQLGSTGRQIIDEQFSFRHYIFDLLAYLDIPLPRVSAIVPNYNYAHYLKQRIDSVLDQSYPLYELIVIDDASSDNSVEVIESCFQQTTIDTRLVKNTQNSGSVFKQWQKAAELAQGDIIWIAEADDDADPQFINSLMPAFNDPETVLAYCQSEQIDEQGQVTESDYLAYTQHINNQKWLQDYRNQGKEEIINALAIKNTIPNASAVLFRKDAFAESMQQCRADLDKLNIAGDWLIYCALLQQGKISYCAESLNKHRRHQQSVTISSSSHLRHLAEVIWMQRWITEQIDLPAKARKLADQYVQTLYQQFQLDKGGVTDWRKNAELEAQLNALSNTTVGV